MKKYFFSISRLTFGTTFLVSAAAKFLDPNSFTESLHSFGLIPSAGATFLTYLIPSAELLLALAFLSRVQISRAAISAALLLVLFIAAGASAAISGVEVENCGCFGELYRSSLGMGFFVRNGVLLILALLLIWLNEAQEQSNPKTSKGTLK